MPSPIHPASHHIPPHHQSGIGAESKTDAVANPPALLQVHENVCGSVFLRDRPDLHAGEEITPHQVVVQLA
jgi:hypothetical protein